MSKDRINCQVSCKHAWMVKANVTQTKLPLALPCEEREREKERERDAGCEEPAGKEAKFTQ